VSDNRRITIQMSVEEMGRLSIALDHFVASADHRANDSEYTRLQHKWDELYKGIHNAISRGVVSLDTEFYK
jgi:hypothetical protein